MSKECTLSLRVHNTLHFLQRKALGEKASKLDL